LPIFATVLAITKRGEANSPLSFYMELKEKLAEMAAKITSENNCQLVDFQLKGNIQQYKLIVLVDTETGIGIDECAKISRQLADLIEGENLIENAYNLEVSSPGIDVPLIQKWQYEKNIGRLVKVFLTTGIEKEGKLTIVTDASITIEGQGKPGKVKKEDKVVVINFDQIKESKVQVSFN